ncbi:MAG TPA: hypothetical protein VNI61_10145 [Gemmatimonadales bacterium]|nr:hypothetical protein [Gemmatimonadales bacterium]
MRAGLPLLVCLFATARLAAQDTAIVIYPDSAGATLEQRELPRIVAEEVIRFFNAPTTTRLVGRTRLPAGNEWRGDVAVRTGPVAVAGRIQGSLVVVNGDVALEEGAEVTGDVIVVGGTVALMSGARVDGEVREYREPLPYRLEGDALVYAPNLRRRFRTLGARRTWGDEDSRSTLTIATGGTFNRVEGLPVVFGPLFDWRLAPSLRLRFDALGVFRSAGDLSDSRSDLGYMARLELRAGEDRAVGVGLRAFDVVSPVEDWGLRSAEVGWAAFLFHRDYRDYHLNKGVAARAFAQVELPLQVALEIRREWHTSVSARDPWTVFRTSHPWRPNPPVDEGHYLTIAGTVTLDTRNDRDNPTAGWYLRAQVEHARSRDVVPQPGLPAAVRSPIPTDGSYAFQRGVFELRRYTRVSPSGRVNLRALAAGWLGGDPLPLQRRLWIGGPEPLPGYPFRHSACNRDVTDPAFVQSEVAACDRLILVQGEYRGHIKLNWTYDPGDGQERDQTNLIRLENPDLVVFGNAGQAWLVGSGPGRLPSDRLPTPGTWLADLGLGVDWNGFGVYVAKAVTVGQPLRFVVRLDHRF